jgi:hypothetical protein
MPRTQKSVLSIAILLLPMVCACDTAARWFGVHDGCLIGIAKAWIDENANGMWDNGEKPLADVVFIVDTQHEITNDSTSNENGQADLVAFPYSCSSLRKTRTTIRATPPSGYQATTQIEVIISQDDLLDSEQGDYYFGFIDQAEP